MNNYPLYGIEFGKKTDWIWDILIGFLLGALFIFISVGLPAFSIGTPNSLLQSSPAGERMLAVLGFAPVLEEFAFRSALPFILSLVIPFTFLIYIISSLAFSVFHWQVYGLGLTSAFFGAFVFGLTAMFVINWRKNILAVSVMHFMVNAYLVGLFTGIIGGLS